MLAYGHPSDPSRAPVHHLVRPCGVRVFLRDHVTSVISSSRRRTLARVRSERVFTRTRMIHEVVRDHRARLVRVRVIIDQTDRVSTFRGHLLRVKLILPNFF